MKKALVLIFTTMFCIGSLQVAAAKTYKIGVSLATFEYTFLQILRDSMKAYGDSRDDIELVVKDANLNFSKQTMDLLDFRNAGFDAIIVNPVYTYGTKAMSDMAYKAGIPLIYVNRRPSNTESFPDNQTFVGSDELESGTLETEQVCKLLKEKGKGKKADIVVLIGALSSKEAVQRTRDINAVISTEECSFMNITAKGFANWSRSESYAYMTDWLKLNIPFDAVIANNDEMAIGAANAMKEAGINMDDVIVAGIDATPDALAAMTAGDIDTTVFQNAVGQGQQSIEAALKALNNEKLPKIIWVPFELVTPENMSEYTSQ